VPRVSERLSGTVPDPDARLSPGLTLEGSR
jgi:hypothetical protein